jgi:putative drug exporter of the RND superfamily
MIAMSSPTGFATPQRLKWLKWVVLVVWLGIIAGLGPLAGKLSGAEKNDATAFLPGKAESTRVFNEAKSFPGGDAIPVVIVYDRASGLTAADKTYIDQRRTAVIGYDKVVGTTPPVIPSANGRSALISFKLQSNNNGNTLLKWADDVRDLANASPPNGLTIDFTGPGGYLRDSLKAFEGIDGKLLVVTVLVVAIILLLTYRSLFLWLMPLISVGFAAGTAQGVVYLLAKAGLVVNGQSAGILTVLVFGAGTDYALLLIARYREELHHTADRHLAMARAYKQAAPALLASGSTVTIGLLCLLFSELESDKGLGPVGAVGVLCALAAQLTLLPSLLLIFGRKLFWPFIPKIDSVGMTEDGPWVRMSRFIGRHPRRIWLGTLTILVGLCFGLLDFNTGLTQEQGFRDKTESVAGQQLIAQSFPAGASQPANVIANASATDAVLAAAKGPGVVTAAKVGEPANGRQQIDVILTQPDGSAANAAVRGLRERLHAVPGANAQVGGQTATTLDVNDASSHDVKVIIPIVLAVVLVILGILLRAIFAPVLLMLTVVLSYLSSLGLAALIYDWGFDFPGSDPSLPLFAFIFLVALGIDYNIFLMSRVREESERGGTRYGTLRGVATTGGVITSAGIVLAATFSVLGVLPLVQLIQVGVVVAVGVLLDTFVVRSLLVPALTLEIGSKIWWPSKLQHVPDHPDAPEPHLPMPEPASATSSSPAAP